MVYGYAIEDAIAATIGYRIAVSVDDQYTINTALYGSHDVRGLCGVVK